jgi:Mitochondrial carrier protein
MSADYSIGLLATITATLITQPLDYMKVQAQVQGINQYMYEGRPSALGREAVSRGGLSQIYIGSEALIARSVVYYFPRAYIFTYLVNKKASQDAYNSVHIDSRTLYGFLASYIAGFISNPFELVLLRKQVNHTLSEPRPFQGLIQSLTISAGEGKAGLWTGASVNALKYGGLAAALIPSYDQLIEFWPRVLGESFVNKPFALMMSTLFGALVSLPFDNIKTKYQRQLPGGEYKSPYDCFLKTAARESLFGLYTGYWFYWGKLSAQSLLIIYLVDFLRPFYYD